jgi:hypothetical protein
LSQPLPHLRFNLFVINQGGFLADQTDDVTKGQVQGLRQEIPLVVLEFSLGLLGLYGVWHCHDGAVNLLPVGLYIFCQLNPEASTELHSTMQNSHFNQASENGLTVFHENPKTQ